jgi:hypothetical protein
MAEALVWHLIRDNNSFLVKRGRSNRAGSVQFSAEPGNLLNVNTFKHSGLANNNTVHIPVVGKKDKVVVIKKVSARIYSFLAVSDCNVMHSAIRNDIYFTVCLCVK